jgi:hypothetical protein
LYCLHHQQWYQRTAAAAAAAAGVQLLLLQLSQVAAAAVVVQGHVEQDCHCCLRVVHNQGIVHNTQLDLQRHANSGRQCAGLGTACTNKPMTTQLFPTLTAP